MCSASLYDWETYSSAKGITLEGLPPDVQPEMITMDPPRHDELRALVKRAFTPTAISALEPRVSRSPTVARRRARPRWVRPRAATWRGLVPSAVIAEMLGIPFSDRPLFREWIEVLDPPQARRARHHRRGTRGERRAVGVPRAARSPTRRRDPHRRPHRLSRERGRRERAHAERRGAARLRAAAARRRQRDHHQPDRQRVPHAWRAAPTSGHGSSPTPRSRRARWRKCCGSSHRSRSCAAHTTRDLVATASRSRRARSS